MHKINNVMSKIKGISEEELKGTKLEGFPEKVIKLMLKRQVEQGNKEDIEVFKKNINAKKEDGGFYWCYTEEGIQAWVDAIGCKRFDLLFKKRKLKIGTKTVKKVFAIVGLYLLGAFALTPFFVAYSIYLNYTFFQLFAMGCLFIVIGGICILFIKWAIEQLKN